MTRSPTDEPRPGDVLSLDLDLLDNNPFQPRTEMDPTEMEGLKASLNHSGQIQPIAVRPNGPGRYQIVAGHRRTAAFRALFAAAVTEAERRRWQLIRAIVVPATTDSEMAISAYVENAARSNLSPLDEAAALARISEMGANLSAPAVAKITGQPERRVRRMLRLNDAPQVVKDAVAPGLMVEVLGEDRQPKRERRRLDLLAALEFTRLHEHHLATKTSTADDRTTTAMSRALKDNWGLRRIQRSIDDTLHGRPERKEPITAPHPAPTARSVPPKDQGTDERGVHEPHVALAPSAGGPDEEAPAALPSPLAVCASSSERFTLYLSRLRAASREQLLAAQTTIDDIRQLIATQLELKPGGT